MHTVTPPARVLCGLFFIVASHPIISPQQSISMQRKSFALEASNTALQDMVLALANNNTNVNNIVKTHVSLTFNL